MSDDIRPGRRERHLLRRRDNPLFPPDRRLVTGAHLAAARAADVAEEAAFREDFAALLSQASTLSGQVDSAVVLELKERADRLYEQCRGLGGDHQAEEQGLNRLLAVLMRAVRAGAGDDPQALDELAQEEVAREYHQRLLCEPLIADLLHPDSPVHEDELVATLLSASPGAWAAALEVFPPEQVRAILERASHLLAGLDANIHQRRHGEALLAQARRVVPAMH